MDEAYETSQVTTLGPDWTALMASAETPPIIEAVTFHRGPWFSASRPVCVKCSDGAFRVLKGAQAGGKMLFNDQVIARLAQRLRAPVPKPALVLLPEQLIAAERRLSHMRSGLCHGLHFLDGHSDRMGIAHTDLPENRVRFAALAVLYGWAHASDHQQIYPDLPPPYVASVDHGHFVGPGDPEWTITLLQSRGPCHIDQTLESGANLTRAELLPPLRALSAVSPADIAADIKSAPEEWGISHAERVSFAGYMWKRRSELLTAFADELTPQGSEGSVAT